MKAAAVTAAKCWAVATPLGLVLRGLSKGYIPPTPFIVVSMVSTAVVLVGWRSALAAVSKKVSTEALGLDSGSSHILGVLTACYEPSQSPAVATICPPSQRQQYCTVRHHQHLLYQHLYRYVLHPY